jgi:hypothetical protein
MLFHAYIWCENIQFKDETFLMKQENLIMTVEKSCIF